MTHRQNSAAHVVVGGGVMGLTSALVLAQAGAQVTLIERGEIGREASWAGGGILSPLYPWQAAEPVWRLAAESLALYPALCRELAEHTGIDPQWTASGMLVLDAGEFARAQAWCARQNLAAELVAAREVEPGLAQAQAALSLPWVAQLRNPRLCQALLQRLRQLGVRLHTQAGAVSLEVSAGRARLRMGSDLLDADAIVVAAGAWTAALLATTGWCLPVVPVAGQMLLLRGEPGRLRHIVLAGGRYLIPRQDGHILVGSTVEDVGFAALATPGARTELQAVATALLPEAADWPVVGHWAGLRPGSPDGIPFIARHPELANLYVNTGQYRNGLTLAPASAARLLSLMRETL